MESCDTLEALHLILPLSMMSYGKSCAAPPSGVLPNEEQRDLEPESCDKTLASGDRTVTFFEGERITEVTARNNLGKHGLTNVDSAEVTPANDPGVSVHKHEEEDHLVLRGYETLQELRRKAADYRKGYINWRQFKPKGARGETSDVFTGRAEQKLLPDLKLLPSGFQLPQQAVATGDAELQRTGIGSATSFRALPTLDEPQPSDDVQFDVAGPRRKSSVGTVIPRPLKDPLIQPFSLVSELRVGAPPVGSSVGLVGLAEDLEVPDIGTLDVVKKADVDEDTWLRFYYNPFTPAEERPAVPLKSSTLDAFSVSPHQQLALPRYNRDPWTVTHWIMHLGVGQFHRSHQLVYMDDILTKRYEKKQEALRGKSELRRDDAENQESVSSISTDVPSDFPTQEKWGYCGVGLMPFDKKMADALRKQDFLYTVLSRNNTTSSARVIGSIFDYVFAYEEPERALERLISPDLRIISLTITEKGYCQDVHGGLDLTNSFIYHDLELLRDISKQGLSRFPQSAIGFIYWGIWERYTRQLVPFTVMSCDNLPDNGHVAKTMVVSFAEQIDPKFAQWISETIRFPATMVDRITPSIGDEHREILAKDFGVLDTWPVVSEVFRQWVIEDDFPHGRPPWEAVGALLVKNVRPFELMKLRLLNGGHSAIAYIAYLAGHRFVDDAITDIRISSFLRTYMDEVTSTIRNVSIELERYKEKIVERFGNRLIKDTITRICEDGSSKFFNTVKDALTELLTENRHVLWTALGVACFFKFLATAPPEIIKDARKEVLIPVATKASNNPMLLHNVSCCLREVFGNELGTHPRFVHHVALALAALKYKSVEAILRNGGVLEAFFEAHLASSSRLQGLVTFALHEQESSFQTAQTWDAGAEADNSYSFARFLSR